MTHERFASRFLLFCQSKLSCHLSILERVYWCASPPYDKSL